MGQFVDHGGEKFGSWTVIGYAGDKLQIVRCECGRVARRQTQALLKGLTKGCGCRQAERHRSTGLKNGTFHGMGHTPTWNSWTAMWERCTRSGTNGYARYSGRGIRICKRWESFKHFLADMGVRPSLEHTIDRIDRDGHYAPTNCRWATRSEQIRNRSDNHWLEHKGQRLILSDWSRLTGIPLDTLWRRLKRCGWSVSRALTEPVGLNRGRHVTAQ